MSRLKDDAVSYIRLAVTSHIPLAGQTQVLIKILRFFSRALLHKAVRTIPIKIKAKL